VAENPLIAWCQRDDDELLYDAEETSAPAQAALAAEGAAQLAYAEAQKNLALAVALKHFQAMCDSRDAA
jgi:hypothetical protein